MGKNLTQKDAPLLEAMQEHRTNRVVRFDVPGHKRGRGNPELTEFLGQQCVGVDVNSMKPLDNLCHPISVIQQAEELAGKHGIYILASGNPEISANVVVTAQSIPKEKNVPVGSTIRLEFTDTKAAD